MILTIPDSVSLKDTRELYVSSCRNKVRPINKKDYLAILANFMKFIIELVFQNNIVQLPNKCGDLFIVGKKVDICDINVEETPLHTLYKPDWKKTKALWANNPQAKEEKRLIYLLNESTSQVLYKMRWNIFLCNLAHTRLYKFVLSRDNKRTMAEIIKEGQEYQVLEKAFKTSRKIKRYEGIIGR